MMTHLLYDPLERLCLPEVVLRGRLGGGAQGLHRTGDALDALEDLLHAAG